MNRRNLLSSAYLWDRDKEEALESILSYVWENELDDFIDFVKDGGEPQDHIFWDCLVASDNDPDHWLRTHGVILME